MTPTETAAILRQFNEWRRLEDDALPYSEVEIGKAIDAAVEMIERLEAAEKSDAESLAMYRKARDERDAQRAKVERMEKRLRLILEEPENTMSNSKALREMVRQARLALEESK